MDNPLGTDISGWTVAKLAWGTVMTILGWLGIRHMNKLEAIEKDYVSKAALKGVLQDWREERLLMHRDNKELLERIESKIDANAGNEAKARGEINSAVNGIALQVAVLNAKIMKS